MEKDKLFKEEIISSEEIEKKLKMYNYIILQETFNIPNSDNVYVAVCEDTNIYIIPKELYEKIKSWKTIRQVVTCDFKDL